jgi:ubiquinone/menaquinone biosynthesis C-methylase UbiE
MNLASERLFHLISARDPAAPASPEAGFDSDDASALRFFARFGSALELEGTRVLDVGCGTGSVCIEAARRGASRVVGIDMQLVDEARQRLRELEPAVAGVIEFVETGGDLEELGSEEFDVIFSKDSFEHYADPERFVHVITRFLAPGGSLVIGFGPPWKAPTGGHIDYMTKLPWAHLIFPEHVIMRERRRFRPDEHAERFEDIVGGLNKITVRRFRSLMASSGLDCTYFASNVSDKAAVRTMGAIARLAPLRELFTINVYSTWRKPLAPVDAAHGD